MVEEARSIARAAVQRAPLDPLAWIMLAEAELDAGDARLGEAAARRALALRPGHPEALARLGRAYAMQGRREEAADALRRASAHVPHHPGIAVWLGHALEDVGAYEEAAEAYARAHAAAPDEPMIAGYLLHLRRKLCDWRDLDRLSQQVRSAVRSGRAAVEPFAFLSETGTAREQLQCARLRAASLLRTVSPLPPAPHAPGARLRVGFLSNGFGAHPTGLLTVAMFEALRAAEPFEVHLFALNTDDHGLVRRRLRAAAHGFHEVAGLPHRAVAQRIRDQRIDVLFDLRGWGGGGAPEVLAMRPASVQVNWLAYPGTSGAPWIDHVLADAFVLPPSLEVHFSERVVRLPRCFQPSDTARVVPEAMDRAAYGLPASGVVYCCFNNSYKLNPHSVGRALRVLREVPGSVLWLLSGPGHADRRLRDFAAAQGVDPARLVFMPKQPHAEYLARLRLADLFLDTEPYNAHTTAADAIWAGCPVLTRPGETFAARVAGSLNHHLGMRSLNTDTDDAFVATAVRLGHDPAARAALRATLADRKRLSGLFDMRAFASDFALAVHAMSGGAQGPGTTSPPIPASPPTR